MKKNVDECSLTFHKAHTNILYIYYDLVYSMKWQLKCYKILNKIKHKMFNEPTLYLCDLLLFDICMT